MIFHEVLLAFSVITKLHFTTLKIQFLFRMQGSEIPSFRLFIKSRFTKTEY